MISAFLKQAVIFGLVFILVFKAQHFLNTKADLIRFSVLDVDIFFAASSLIICLHFLFLERFPKIKPQLGYIYLPTLFIKSILFYLFFQDTVFEIETFAMAERLNLFIPLALFLTLEVYVITKILNR